MHELTFVNQVTTWINEILHKRLDLPFTQATIEESAKGKRKRRDLTLYDRQDKLALTGEIKLPDKPDGLTPYNETVVIDAHRKANDIGAAYFFTWNVNRLVLWKTFEPGVPLIERDQRLFEVVNVRASHELTQTHIQAHIQAFLEEFLTFFADVHRGLKLMPVKPLDERFIDMLDTALDTIVLHTVDALHQRYQSDLTFRAQLVDWMINDMGWTHSEQTLLLDLERAAKVSNYRLVNKLMFYNALRRRYSNELPAIAFSPLDDTGERMQQTLNEFFNKAMIASGDYETVYLRSFADALPFLAQVALTGWRDLIAHIDAYDFTRLNYDVVGRVFERLISPKERHRYGQHYTLPDLVDVINGFCIRRPDAIVADPACGGGTFLVRAYARKKYLSQNRLPHLDLISQLYGLDISPFAAHLALINLAARDLDAEPNYPLIAVDDFFNVRRGHPVFQIPTRNAVTVEGLGNQTAASLSIDRLDAVVGNPPYVRQELIDQVFQVKGRPDQPYKQFLADLQAEEWGKTAPKLSARSDLYVYFWPHAASFVPEGGHLGFLTGSGWLDNEYGFRLQEFMLKHFQVLAVLESEVEPWFSEARVNTAATILRRTGDPAARADHMVKFVLLRRKLSDLLPHTEDETERQRAVDALVAEIEGLTENVNNDRWRVRLVNQGQLTLAGWEPDDEAGPVDLPNNWRGDWNELRALGGHYAGTKWSVHLRAPDLFFEILDTFADRLVPLREVAGVKYGIKSGADKFFYVQDITDELDNETLAERYGLARDQTGQTRVVKSGDGSAHLIEARYLQPLIFNVMELDGLQLDNSGLRKKIFLVDGQPDELKGTYALKYIRYGEQAGYHENTTCQGRVIEGERAWYELRSSLVGGEWVWPKAHQYRHIVTFNSESLPINCRLYAIKAKTEVDSLLLGAILNSTLIGWFKEIYGRVMGREGNTDTMVTEVKQMLIVDPLCISLNVVDRLYATLEKLMRRPALPIYPMGAELDQSDRVELDDAIFEALGVAHPSDRYKWREWLYDQLKQLYKHKRELELIAMSNRVKAARTKMTASYRTLAKEIWRDMDKSAFRCFPDDFILPGIPTKRFDLPGGEIQVGRELFTGAGSLGVGYIMIGEELRYVGSMIKAEFIQAWQEAGHTGAVFVPEDEQTCDDILAAYARYRADIQAQATEWASSRTADLKLQEQVVNLLWKYINEYVQAK